MAKLACVHPDLFRRARQGVSEALALASLLGLCACDTFVATVGVVQPEVKPLGSPQDAGAAPPSARDAAPPHDAGDDEPHDTGHPDAGMPALNCVVLIDQSTSVGHAADGGVILGQTRAESGCTTSIDSEASSCSIYWRADGALLLEASKTYSFRWKGLNTLGKLRLNGGADKCAVDLIHLEPTPALNFTLPVPNGCVAFAAPIDARYVRLQTDWAVWLPSATPVAFQLCESPCPASL